MGILEGGVKESVGGAIGGINTGAKLNVGERSMGNGGRHVCIVGEVRVKVQWGAEKQGDATS